jgi:hypothetical protein
MEPRVVKIKPGMWIKTTLSEEEAKKKWQKIFEDQEKRFLKDAVWNSDIPADKPWEKD